jgi:hypothetical protein
MVIEAQKGRFLRQKRAAFPEATPTVPDKAGKLSHNLLLSQLVSPFSDSLSLILPAAFITLIVL